MISMDRYDGDNTDSNHENNNSNDAAMFVIKVGDGGVGGGDDDDYDGDASDDDDDAMLMSSPLTSRRCCPAPLCAPPVNGNCDALAWRFVAWLRDWESTDSAPGAKSTVSWLLDAIGSAVGAARPSLTAGRPANVFRRFSRLGGAKLLAAPRLLARSSGAGGMDLFRGRSCVTNVELQRCFDRFSSVRSTGRDTSEPEAEGFGGGSEELMAAVGRYVMIYV